MKLEGDGVEELRVLHDTGYLLVSTSDQGPPVALEKRPGVTLCHLGSPVPRGSVLVTKTGALAAHRPPGGAWRLFDDVDHADATAAIAKLSEASDPAGRPPAGAIRIGAVDYALTGTTLSRFAWDGTLLSSVVLSPEPLTAALHRAGPAAVARFEHMHPSRRYPRDLTHDRRRNRIIAWAWSMPGWVIALGLDGAIEWATIPTIECCNFVRLLPREDTIVQMASCGRRLTFISGDGATLGVRDFDVAPTSFFVDGEGGVVVAFVDGGIARFDALGVQHWTFDCPWVREAVIEEGVMYAVTSPERGLLEVNAFDLEGFKSA